MMKASVLLMVLVAAPVAGPVAAQEFQLPAGCEAYLTMQGKDCTVTHTFTCEGDASGEQRRADLDEEGLTYVGRINEEAEWVESFHLRSQHSERLASSVDRMMISELISEGIDTFEFETESAEIGVSRYVGVDRLAGDPVIIDGVELQPTEYQIKAFDGFGNEIWSASGSEYISTEWRMFISGISTYETSAGVFEADGTPVEFIFPGEPGFLSVNPKYGCGAQMSSYEVTQ